MDKQITLSGKISFQQIGYFENIFLVSENGFMIDLVSRVKEIKMSYSSNKIQVNYWLSVGFSSKNEMIKNIIEKIYCKDITADYEDTGYMGSSQTGWCEAWDTELKFGGHDLFEELMGQDGRFMIIEFNILNNG